MKKAKKLESSLKAKAEGIKHMESVLQAPSPDKEDLKIVGTDEEKAVLSSSSFGKEPVSETLNEDDAVKPEVEVEEVDLSFVNMPVDKNDMFVIVFLQNDQYNLDHLQINLNIHQ